MSAAWADGLSTVTAEGVVLDAWFPSPRRGSRQGAAPVLPPLEFESALGHDPVRDVTIEFVSIDLDTAAPPASTADAYLRLHLLSHLLVRPNEVNLDGLIPLLPIAVFTSAGPMALDALERRRTALRRAGISIHGVDKFPRLLDYVTPERVRIADASRVRLGAHLAPGTTVMHEGFVNFNAGTLGPSMVEGRISQGVVVGAASDIGGGASIMGTLSGGGRERVSIGERSLLGANSGTGVSIGDDCVVEAGLYLTAGTRVLLTLPDAPQRTVKALELSGSDGLLFRRNSTTGAVEALPRTGPGIQLNLTLHA